jgi:hypothetical protein
MLQPFLALGRASVVHSKNNFLISVELKSSSRPMIFFRYSSEFGYVRETMVKGQRNVARSGEL